MLTPYEKASHLWRRAGFGACARELEEMVERGIERTLDDLLDLDRDDPRVDETLAAIGGDAFDLNNNADDVRAWWLFRMVHSRHPLREKLTLFWHGHFATSAAKVERAGWMLEQNRMLRRLADAPFRELLDAVTKDPAMLVWLDGATNRKAKPNENYARELLELFSLGIGHYSESDIREAARAFTGWNLAEGAFRFDPKQHDDGEKELLGQRGKLDGKDVLDALATHPATGPFLARKLCRFFVNDAPSSAYVARVAEVYERSQGMLRPTIEAVFRDPEFFAEENVRAVVKSPAEFVASALRVLDVRVPLRVALPAMRRMGQVLLAPPTVKGWEGGPAWLTSAALFERANFAAAVASTRGLPGEPRFQPQAWMRGKGLDALEEVVDALAHDVVQGPLSPQTRNAVVEYLRPELGKDLDTKLRGAARLLLASPEFQLA
jgi:uncharacterized protein (DUF1800 family)